MFSTKAELRKNALQRRDGIDPKTRADLSSRLAVVGLRLVFDFLPAEKRPVVSLFSAIDSEPDVTRLATTLDAAGVQLALPVDWSPGTALVYRRWAPGDRLAAGPLGILEPSREALKLEPDVLFMPLAAFDRRGHRIGYGAGNVDRTLRLLRSRKPVLAIGVGYALQEELIIPSERHDEPLDLIVTERDVIHCRN